MIEAVELSKRFGSIQAVDSISFTVQQGEILGFLGPNGAGKSTTMKMLTGFLRPDLGTARINGNDILSAPLAAKQQFGYLPETGPLYPEMTVGSFLRFAAEIRGLRGTQADAAVEQASAKAHLSTVLKQPLETLSKGYRQRVGLAQAIIHNPPCLILDEPTDGLDPNQKSEVRNLIRAMASEKAIILSTHILEEVEAICSRVIIVNHGRIIADASPQALLKSHPDAGAVHVRLSDDTAATAKIRDWARARQWSCTPIDGGLRLQSDAQQPPIPALLEFARSENIAIADVQPLPLKLDSVFAKLTANTLN